METIFWGISLVIAIILLNVAGTIASEIRRSRNYRKTIADYEKWEKQLEQADKVAAKKLNENISEQRKSVFNSHERSPVI